MYESEEENHKNLNERKWMEKAVSNLQHNPRPTFEYLSTRNIRSTSKIEANYWRQVLAGEKTTQYGFESVNDQQNYENSCALS